MNYICDNKNPRNDDFNRRYNQGLFKEKFTEMFCRRMIVVDWLNVGLVARRRLFGSRSLAVEICLACDWP